jgi:hypothetical protein
MVEGLARFSFGISLDLSNILFFSSKGGFISSGLKRGSENVTRIS